MTSAPLSKYLPYHTRLCRPIGLSFEDRNTVCRYAINRIGFGYDTKNILDLMRFIAGAAFAARELTKYVLARHGDASSGRRDAASPSHPRDAATKTPLFR